MQIVVKKHISLFWTRVIPTVGEQVLLTFPRMVPAAYFLTHWKIFITAGAPCIIANALQLGWRAAVIYIKIKYSETFFRVSAHISVPSEIRKFENLSSKKEVQPSELEVRGMSDKLK